MLAALGLGAAISLLFALTINAPHARLPLLLVAVVLAVCATFFSSLTIELSERSLSWRFGPGLLRRQVATAEIAGAVVTETRLILNEAVRASKNFSGRTCTAVSEGSAWRIFIGWSGGVIRLTAIGRFTLTII